MEGNRLKSLSEGAIMVALAIVLNFLKVDLGPEGGSVNFVFIPLMLFSIRRGTGWGMLAGAVFGTLKALIGGGISYGWQSLLLDYAVAYALVGLAGAIKDRVIPSVILGSFGCLFSFVMSGVLVWGEYIPESFWGMRMTNIWVYSLLYNGSFVVVNAVIAAAILGVLGKTTKLVRRQPMGKQK